MRRLVFFPTSNIGKYDRYKTSFEKEGIIYKRYLTSEDGVDLKVDVLEDGKTLKENAEKKAKAYYDEYRKHLHDEAELKMYSGNRSGVNLVRGILDNKQYQACDNMTSVKV